MWLWVGDMYYDLNQYKADRREVRERERDLPVVCRGLGGDGGSLVRASEPRLDERRQARERELRREERGEKRKSFYTSRKPSKNDDVLKFFFFFFFHYQVI